MPRASPMARAAVVEAVGARPRGQASDADGDVEVHVGGLGQGRAGVAGHGHEGRPQALHLGHEGQELLGLAAVAEGEHDVALDHAPEVAVDGVGGVEVERRRSGGGQGGRDLLADEAALAHARDHDAPGAGEERSDRAIEARVDAGEEVAGWPAASISSTRRAICCDTPRMVSRVAAAPVRAQGRV